MGSQPTFSREHLKELKLWKRLMAQLLKKDRAALNRVKVEGEFVSAGQLSWYGNLLTVAETEQMYLNPETLRVQVRRYWPTGKWRTLSSEETAKHLTRALESLATK